MYHEVPEPTLSPQVLLMLMRVLVHGQCDGFMGIEVMDRTDHF